MANRILSSHSTHEWHTLVSDAQHSAGVNLDEELESYLVFMLMRYTDKPEMAASVLALDYLAGANALGQVRQDRMRDVGDQCLLYSGLFPERAERRRVKVSYYVDLGRSAYHTAADATHQTLGQLFIGLASQFVLIMDTLQAMRGIDGESPPARAHRRLRIMAGHRQPAGQASTHRHDRWHPYPAGWRG